MRLELTGNVICMIVFFQEGVPIESDRLISNTPSSEEIAYSFCNKDHNLQCLNDLSLGHY